MILPLLSAAFTGVLSPPVVAQQGSPGVTVVAQGGTERADNDPFAKLFGAKPTPKVPPPARPSRRSAGSSGGPGGERAETSVGAADPPPIGLG